MSVLTEWPREAYDDGAFRDLDPAAGFTLGNARAMAWAAKLAYETDHVARMRDIAAAWGLAALEPVTSPASDPGSLVDPDTRGFVATGPRATIVAVAGTDPLLLPNWITNLSIKVAPEERGGLHTGFRRAAVAAQPAVKAALDRLHRDDRPLLLVGHSLGGALAVLTARWLEQEGRTVRGVYAFGMPRIGDRAFATDCGAQFGDRLYRLVHGDDVVASVPFTAVGGYRHVGRLLRCPSGGRFAAAALSADWSSNEPDFGRDVVNGLLRRPIDPSAPAWPAERTGLAGRVAAKLVEVLPAALRDHLPDRYIAACAAA